MTIVSSSVAPKISLEPSRIYKDFITDFMFVKISTVKKEKTKEGQREDWEEKERRVRR